LDINPEYMRRGLRRWKERKLAELARQRESTQTAAAETSEEFPTEKAVRQKNEPVSRTPTRRSLARRVHEARL
jgi:hypothetical protein